MQHLPAILTIGHSNHPIERFLQLLQGAGVTMLADVRSFPVSRHAPQYNREALAGSLEASRIVYAYCGKELGGRAEVAAAAFRRGLDRVIAASATHRVALMCAERDPLDCHRWLWLSRELTARGVEVAHILASGEVASQRATEDRLLEAEKLAAEDFFPREQRLHDAYRARSGHRLAARAAE